MTTDITTESIMVCNDCLMIIANDDASGLDYHLDEEASAEREEEIRSGIKALQEEMGGHVSAGDSEQDDDFSTDSCDTCGIREHGSRHHCLVVIKR